MRGPRQLADRDEPSGSPGDQVPRPWQPRFGLGSMLLVMFVCSVMAAAGYYFVQAVQGDRAAQLRFILFTLASPLLLAVLLSLVRWAVARRDD